jgi:hypothetical protein
VDGVKGDWGIAGILRTKGEIRQGSRIVPAFDAEREGGGGAGVLCGLGVVALRPPSLCESKEGTVKWDLKEGTLQKNDTARSSRVECGMRPAFTSILRGSKSISPSSGRPSCLTANGGSRGRRSSGNPGVPEMELSGAWLSPFFVQGW